jgi:hypothetical protein
MPAEEKKNMFSNQNLEKNKRMVKTVEGKVYCWFSSEGARQSYFLFTRI